jgi:hypothetical protein
MRVFGDQFLHAGISPGAVLFVQTTHGDIGPKASRLDFQEQVFIPESGCTVQVIHIVFKLMITKQNCLLWLLEKPPDNATKKIAEIKVPENFFKIICFRGNILTG